MKRKLNLLDKIFLFFTWLHQQEDDTLIGCCTICESTHLKRITSNTDQPEGINAVLYKACYECIDCGAVAAVKETWFRKEDEK